MTIAAALLPAGIALAEPADEFQPTLETLDTPLDFSTPLPPPKHPGRKIDASKFVPKMPKTDWEAKVGVDNNPALPNPGPESSTPAAPTGQSVGVAWANVTAPGLMIMDKTALETRLDPHQQGKLGLSMSRTVPVGSGLSVTWQNSYSVTQPLSQPAASPLHPPSAQVFDSNQAIRFTILPADTTVSLAATISNTTDRWMRSMSAERKLFGGPVSLTGAVQETPSGDLSKSLKAGFKRTW
jgi:hypothetical protein